MADYTAIDPNSLLPGQPITSALGQALEENPRAIAEGATGAPRNMAPSIEDLLLGKVDGAGTSASGFTDIDPRVILRIDGYWQGATLGSDPAVIQQRRLQVRVSNDGGSNWSSWQNVGANLRKGISAIFADMKNGTAVALAHELTDVGNDPSRDVQDVDIDFGRQSNDAIQVRLDGTGNYVAIMQLVSRASDE